MPRTIGYKHSEQTKRKISTAHKRLGSKPSPKFRNPNVVINCTICANSFEVVYSRKDTAKYCSVKCRAVGVSMLPGNKAGKFTGTTYGAYHYKVRALRGKPSNCEVCGTDTAKKFEWANLTGNYSDVNDYKRMCASCHKKHDNVINNLKKPD